VKILLLHNFYQQPGGEDVVFENEAKLLEGHGHSVVRYILHNQAVADMNSMTLGIKTLWNRTTHTAVRALILRNKIDLCHFHNTFPLISPAAYYAAKGAGVPVVQTLHNYRLLCPGATFFRDGRICEDCLQKPVPWQSIKHACYRGSVAATIAVTGMLSVHRAVGTWSRAVDSYIALSEFARRKFIEGGFPPDKMMLKHNFIHPDPGCGTGDGGFGLFVGRLVPEKGITTLIEACRRLEGRVKLKVAGDGPLRSIVAEAARSIPGVEWLGQVPTSHVRTLMGNARFVVVPSEWYEGMPMAILEAFAKGTPVVASRLGSMEDLVCHGSDGLHFRAGDAVDLAQQMLAMVDNPRQASQMRRRARQKYEQGFTSEVGYTRLMDIYAKVLSNNLRQAG
jgi:glycosyltransferase involved in cell wall biosynthesis